MELRQLEIFSILAHELSFTRAAQRAHCVQSNVSVQIRSLEDELKVRLFERLGQTVKLTPYGVRLLTYAEQVLRLLQEARAVTTGAIAGPLVIGSPESVLTYRLPGVIRAFRTNFPEVDLAFRSVGTPDLKSLLERGDIDIGLVIDEHVGQAGFHVESLCPEPIVLVVQPGHPMLKQTTKLTAEQLGSQTFVLTDVGCAYRLKLERALGSWLRPRTIMEFTSVEAIKRCVALGMGIACLPRIAVQQELANETLSALPWKGPALDMNMLVVWHQDKWQSPAMQAFVSMLRLELSHVTRAEKTTSGRGRRSLLECAV